MGLPYGYTDPYKDKYAEQHPGVPEGWTPPGSATAEEYIAAARSRTVIIHDVVAAAAIAWTQTTGEPMPEDLRYEAIRATTVDEAREIITVGIGEEVDNDAEKVQIANAIDSIAEARAGQRMEVIRKFDKHDEGTIGGFLTPAALVPSRPLFNRLEVEAELDRRVGAIDKDSVTQSVLDEINEEAELIGSEGVATSIRREMGFIGGLDSATYTGIIDGERVPVDPNTGEPVDIELHEPKGIYDSREGDRIAGSYLSPYQNEFWLKAGQGGPYTSMLEANVPHIQRYHPGFQWEPASWDPVEVARVKERLVRSGLLDPEDRTSGAGWSHYEARAMSVLAEAANATGELWTTTLGALEANPIGGNASDSKTITRSPFVAPSYLAPDMDILKQAVKDSVRGRLGREPTTAEMQQLLVGLDSDYRSAYNVQVQASRSEYDATTRAIDTETEQSGGEFRNVDPAASFAERFEARFDNEIGFKKRRDDLNLRQSYTDATMRMIDSVAGGG